MCYIDMVKEETESIEYQYPGSCVLSSTGDARDVCHWEVLQTHLMGLGAFRKPLYNILLQEKIAEMLLESPWVMLGSRLLKLNVWDAYCQYCHIQSAMCFQQLTSHRKRFDHTHGEQLKISSTCSI